MGSHAPSACAAMALHSAPPSPCPRRVPCQPGLASKGTQQPRVSKQGSFPSKLRRQCQASQGGQVSPVFSKICGLTQPEDASVAARCGASYAGMILWPKAKRYVGPATAKNIAARAREHGAEPVGVFVDGDAEEICRVCESAEIRVAQLHGDVARSAFPFLPRWLSVIYVAHVDAQGTVATPLPFAGQGGAEGAKEARLPEFLLLDGLQGGSGQALNWPALRVPPGAFSRGWILAGGLSPSNVRDAVAALAPSGVDVSSGVCAPDGLTKDHGKIRAFIQEASGGGILKAR